MRVAIIIFILLSSLAYAAVPPSAEFYVIMDDILYLGEDIRGEFLWCDNEEQPDDYVTPEVANIREYDEERDCYWVPFVHSRGEGVMCKYGRCSVFPVPAQPARLALYMENMNQTYQTFITNEVIPHPGYPSDYMNYYRVVLSSDGSAVISETTRDDVESNYIGDEDIEDDNNVPPPKSNTIYYVIAFVFLAFVAWIIFKKKK